MAQKCMDVNSYAFKTFLTEVSTTAAKTEHKAVMVKYFKYIESQRPVTQTTDAPQYILPSTPSTGAVVRIKAETSKSSMIQ